MVKYYQTPGLTKPAGINGRKIMHAIARTVVVYRVYNWQSTEFSPGSDRAYIR